MNTTERGLFHTGSGVMEEMNIKEMILKYFRYWYLFVIGVVFCLLAAFFHIRYNTTAQYYISSTLLIKEDNSRGGLSEGISGGMGNFSINQNIGNEIVLLKSRNLMERVFSELAINEKYYVKGRFKNVEVYKDDLPITLIVSRLDSLAFGRSLKINILNNNNFALIENDEKGAEIISKHKFGQEINKSYAVFTVIGSSDIPLPKEIMVEFHDLRKLAESYSQSLGIQLENKEAKVLRLSLTDPIPQRSIAILTKLVEVFDKEGIEDKNQVELNTIEFLDDRIQYLSTELSEVEKDVEQYKQQNNLTDVSSNAQLYMERASDYNQQLDEFEIQIDLLNSLEDYMKQDKPKLVPSSLYISDPTLNVLIGKFNELQLERQRLLRTIQPSSSLIRNIDDQLSNLKVNIGENLKNIRNGLMITRTNLQSSSAQFQSRIQKVPSIERELLEINRQQSIKQAIYLFLLQRREEAGLSLASSTANSRIIDAATAGNYPISPNKGSIYFTSLILGLLLPLAFIYLREKLNDKITDRKEVEHGTNLQILGEIYHSDTNNTLQITDGDHSIIAETFRLIRTNLLFASLGKENMVILVTSSRSGEGKTFFTANLGASLALSGKKVVILEFDLRGPKLMNDLGLQDQLGITDYLISEEISLESLLVPFNEVNGLFAIGAGTLPPNPAELMMSTKVKQLIEELKKQFDYIVIDSSPVGQVADAFNLAPYADFTLFIVRYNYSYTSQLTIIEEIYQNKKLKQPMVVMNDAKKKNIQSYDYHSDGKKLKVKRKPLVIKNNQR